MTKMRLTQESGPEIWEECVAIELKQLLFRLEI